MTRAEIIEQMRNKFLEESAALWDDHQEQFLALVHNGKVRLKFRAQLDFTEEAGGARNEDRLPG